MVRVLALIHPLVAFLWAMPHGRYGRIGYGIVVFHVFATSLHSGILGALLTFAGRVWYPIYAERTSVCD